MTTLAFYNPRSLDIDFRTDSLPPWLYNEIASLHGQIRRADNPPILTCRGNGEPLYVYKTGGRYFVRHFPHGNADGHDHGVMRRMSDEHRYQAEYGMRAAQNAGFKADLEVSTGHQTRPRRIDVGIYGPVQTGLEVQRSSLTAPQAKRRAADQFDAGWTSAWISDWENDPPWTDWVPTARLSVRGWDCVPPANTAKVIISRIRRVRDNTRRTGWRYEREPFTVLYDELAYLMPAGEIIPVSIGTKGRVLLADKASAEVIDSCTYPGASNWDPRPKVQVEVRDASQRKSLYCRHENLPSYQGDIKQVVTARPKRDVGPSGWAPDILPRPPRPAPVVREPVIPSTPIDRPQCGCGNWLLAPVSINRGYCEACRMRKAVAG